MALDLKTFNKLSERVDSVQRQADRKLGEADSLKARMKEDYDCHTLRDVRSSLESGEEELAQLEEEFNRELKRFQEEYGDRLKGTEEED